MEENESYSLREFTYDMVTTIEEFEQYWLKNHELNPEMFPLNMEKDNSGLWFEQFISFVQTDPETLEKLTGELSGGNQIK